jgi:D-threo-aldose 1-dehydrogenase
MTEFPRRQIGHTGLQVTELGLGCATLDGSQMAVARAAAEEIVGAAWAAGVRYVDAAPYYGVGQAERCVGDELRDRPRGEWVLSTKVGRLLRRNPTGVFADGRRHPLPFEAVYDYSYDGIMRSFEDSFQRLGLARIDILYVHDIGAYQHGAEANAVLMKTLRESGYRALETPT